MTDGLHNPTAVVDERGTRPDQRIARVQDGKIVLSVLTAVLDGAQKLRVETPDPSECFGIDEITLTVTAVDETQVARIADDHLVTQLVEKTTDPR